MGLEGSKRDPAVVLPFDRLGGGGRQLQAGEKARTIKTVGGVAVCDLEHQGEHCAGQIQFKSTMGVGGGVGKQRVMQARSR